MQSKFEDEKLMQYIKKYTTTINDLVIPRIPTTFLNIDAGRPIIAVGSSGSGKSHMSLSLLRQTPDLTGFLFVSESAMDEGKNELLTQNIPEMFIINSVDDLLKPQLTLNNKSIMLTFHEYCESTVTIYKKNNKEERLNRFINDVILNKKSIVNKIDDCNLYNLYMKSNKKNMKYYKKKEYLKMLLSNYLAESSHKINDIFLEDDVKFILVLLSNYPKFLIIFDDVSEKLKSLTNKQQKDEFKKALTQSRGHYTTILFLHDIKILQPDERTGSAIVFMDEKSISSCSGNINIENEIKDKSKFIGQYFNKNSSDPFVKYSYLVYLPELDEKYQEILKKAGYSNNLKWFSICCDGVDSLVPEDNYQHFTNKSLQPLLKNYAKLKKRTLKEKQKEEEKLKLDTFQENNKLIDFDDDDF